DILRKSGMKGQSKQKKTLPVDIYQYDRKALSEFIAGYFDADGNVKSTGKRRSLQRLVLTSVNEGLLQGVKYLLTKFGINSSIVMEKRNTPPSREYRGQTPFIHRLYITKGADIERFKKSIPLMHSKKVEGLKKIEKRNRTYGRSKSYFIYDESYGKGKYFKDKGFIN